MLAGGVIGAATGNPVLGLELGATFGGMFAQGGRYPTGRDILVGEKGPEIVRIDRPGEVIPNHRLNLDARKMSDYPGFRERAAALLGPPIGPLAKWPALQIPAALRDAGVSSGAMQQLQAVVQEAVQSGRIGGGAASAASGDVSQSITIFGGVHGDKAVGRAGKAWGSSLRDAVNMR